MSLATDLNTGGVIDAIAERLAADDARRRELLDWLDAHGFGATPQNRIPAEVLDQARRELGHVPASRPSSVKTFAPAPPAPPVPAQPTTPTETTMPCSNCHGAGHNARSCPDPKPAPAEKPAKTAKPAPKRTRAATTSRECLEELSVDDLVELRSAVDVELQARKVAAEAELARITEALKAA